MKRLLRDVGYFVILCLMMIGVGGLVYNAVGKDGWIGRFLGGVFDQGFGTILATVIGLAVCGWLTRRWFIASQRNLLFNDFLMYGMVALGVLFLGRWLRHGTF